MYILVSNVPTNKILSFILEIIEIDIVISIQGKTIADFQSINDIKK